jgi:hypothetical protein
MLGEKNNSPIAREILKPFYRDTDSIVGTPEWADVPSRWVSPSPQKIRLKRRNFGHFLISVAKRPDKARPFYVEAKALAVAHRFAEPSACAIENP